VNSGEEMAEKKSKDDFGAINPTCPVKLDQCEKSKVELKDALTQCETAKQDLTDLIAVHEKGQNVFVKMAAELEKCRKEKDAASEKLRATEAEASNDKDDLEKELSKLGNDYSDLQSVVQEERKKSANKINDLETQNEKETARADEAEDELRRMTRAHELELGECEKTAGTLRKSLAEALRDAEKKVEKLEKSAEEQQKTIAKLRGMRDLKKQAGPAAVAPSLRPEEPVRITRVPGAPDGWKEKKKKSEEKLEAAVVELRKKEDEIVALGATKKEIETKLTAAEKLLFEQTATNVIAAKKLQELEETNKALTRRIDNEMIQNANLRREAAAIPPPPPPPAVQKKITLIDSLEDQISTLPRDDVQRLSGNQTFVAIARIFAKLAGKVPLDFVSDRTTAHQIASESEYLSLIRQFGRISAIAIHGQAMFLFYRLTQELLKQFTLSQIPGNASFVVRHLPEKKVPM